MTDKAVFYYQLNPEEALKNLESNKDGLTAHAVSERLKLYGKNKLISVDKVPLIFKLLAQFKDLMVILLIAAGSISLYLKEYRDAIIMFTIVLVNAFIGFFQEYKAERIMDSLKHLVVTKAKVVRDGKEIEIDGETLVPGDIVILEEGDAVPADVRLIEENNFGTNDFSLTGESNPAKKFIHPIKGQVQLGDRNNLAFMGTTVAVGNAVGVVVATGMKTEIGRLANLSQETEDEPSPLQVELNHLAKKLTIITLGIGVALFILGLFLHFDLRDAFLFALGIAASCVPEGLPAQVSVALSLAASRLAKDKAVIKKLSAVETLGSTHIICTDKTGTLTKNEMTVLKVVIGESVFDVTGSGYEAKGKMVDNRGEGLSLDDLKKYELFFENGVFSSNAKVNPPDTEHHDWYAIGDPTEAALITLAKKACVDPVLLDKQFPELKEFTFDSVRKRMSSVRRKEDKYFVYVKGSPQGLLEKCTKFWDGEKVRPITQKDRDLINKLDDDFARQALRNLGYAYKEISNFSEKTDMDQVESDLIWLGLVAMIDPPREEVRAAMEMALKANIRVIIITGDYSLTAAAIAERIGLNAGSKQKMTVVTGDELEKMSDIDLLHKLIYDNLIFARTSPEEKLRIVGLLKNAGEVVAVTGDGVNDAPALKKADIGVAMGKTGTEVAKESSEIVLLDDSFASLVSAIREGRTIFANLKKTIMSSLTSNGGELFAVLLSLPFTLIYHYPLSILAVQILAVDLVGEMLPLTFLTWDPAHENIMTRAPRNPSDHIINRWSIVNIAWAGFLMGALAYVNFLWLFFREGVSPINISADSFVYMRATTLTYVSIVFAQWMNIVSRRAGEKTVFTSYLWSNKRLILSYGFSLFFILNIVYNPFVSNFLRTAPLTLIDWAYAVLAAIVYLMVREFYKFYLRKKAKTVDVS